MSITEKFIDFILKLQNKQRLKRLARLNRGIYKFTNGDEKECMTSYATLTIKTKSQKTAQTVKEQAAKIVKENIKTPEKLLKYVESHGTRVYKLKNADKLLSFVKEEEGLIFPKKGFKALYLNMMTSGNFSFKTSEMFILRDLPVNIYIMAHQFHKWWAYKSGMSGFDSETQEKYLDIYKYENPQNVERLGFEDIIKLKQAIKRDVEAIDFVLELSRQNEGSQKCLAKIKDGTGANI